MREGRPVAESGSDVISLPTVRDHLFDPPPELSRLREREPLCRLAYPDGHIGWLVTSYALSRSLLSDSRFSSRSELRRPAVSEGGVDALWGQPAPLGFFIAMDSPEHTRYRRLLTGQFTMRRMKEHEPQIERIVHQHLDTMQAAGPPVDLVRTFALPVPLLAICELFGVPDQDREEFHRKTAEVQNLESSVTTGAAALQSLTKYVRELVRHKRAHPSHDLLSRLAVSGELTDDELAGLGVLLVGAGHETTANMLALGTFALLRHPTQIQELRTNPSLIDNAVEELLRYLSIFQFGITRTALEDVAISGRIIEAGETVTISLPAANRDPEQFEDPDRLDISRDPTGHLAFAHGVHMCLGQHLARIEMRVGYLALLQRFPELRLAVPAEDVPMCNDTVGYGVHQLLVAW